MEITNTIHRAFIVINADDLGLSKSSTLGVIESHLNGVVTSASLVVTTPACQFSVDKIHQKCPRIGLGLHFTLSAGKPISEFENVQSLVDSRGNFSCGFFKLFIFLALFPRKSLLHQIENELRAQIRKMKSFGFEIDHLNSERHIHMIPSIFKVMMQVAQEENIPYVRLVRDVGAIWWTSVPLRVLFFQGRMVKFFLLKILSRINKKYVNSNTSVPDGYATMLAAGRMDCVLKAILLNPMDGVTEVGVHPGRPDQAEEDSILDRDLLVYLKSNDRLLELNGCREARNVATPAQLVRFKDLPHLLSRK